MSLEGILFLKLDNRLLLFPVFEPSVARNPTIMLVDLPVTFSPVVKFTLADADPRNNLLGRDFRPVRSVAHIVDDLIAGVLGIPGSGQSSPSTF